MMLMTLLDLLLTTTGLTMVVTVLSVAGASLIAADGVPPDDPRPRPEVTLDRTDNDHVSAWQRNPADHPRGR